MAEGKGRHDWDQTSLLWCMLANANRDPKQCPKPFLPSDVHPYRSDEDYESPAMSIEEFGAQYMRNQDG